MAYRIRKGEIVVFRDSVGLYRGTSCDHMAIVDLYQIIIPSANDFTNLGLMSPNERKETIALAQTQARAQHLGRKFIPFEELVKRVDEAKRNPPDLEFGDTVLVLNKDYFGIVGNVYDMDDESWGIVTSSNQVNHLPGAAIEEISSLAAAIRVPLDEVVPYDPERLLKW